MIVLKKEVCPVCAKTIKIGQILQHYKYNKFIEQVDE